jgi:hypothetical protein
VRNKSRLGQQSLKRCVVERIIADRPKLGPGMGTWIEAHNDRDLNVRYRRLCSDWADRMRNGG